MLTIEKGEDRVIYIDEVTRLTGLGRSTIRRYMRTKEFPDCTQISPRKTGWWLSDIVNWVNDRRVTKGGEK
jgi:predicted DNA-binding transcriptional regulator AlpA